MGWYQRRLHGVRSQQHEVRPPPPRPYWRSFRHRAHTCQLGLRSCRQDCPHQVPSSLVRPLQIYEASMGQTYGRVRRTRISPCGRCGLHRSWQATLRFQRRPRIPYHQVRRPKQPRGLQGRPRFRRSQPVCSTSNIDICDATQKAEIEKFQAMSADELTAAIAGKDKEGVDAEALFKSEVEKLQKTYEQLQKDKETTLEKIKKSGLGIMKAVKAAGAAGKDEV